MENEVITEEVVDNADDIFTEVVEVEEPRRPVLRNVAIIGGIIIAGYALVRFVVMPRINARREQGEAREQEPVDVECYEDEE